MELEEGETVNFIIKLGINIIHALLNSFNINDCKKAENKTNYISQNDMVNMQRSKNRRKYWLYNLFSGKGNDNFKTTVIGFNCNHNNRLVRKYNKGSFGFICYLDIDLTAKTLIISGKSLRIINQYKHSSAEIYRKQYTDDNKPSGDITEAVNGTIQSDCSSNTVNLIESTVKDTEDIIFTDITRDL